MLSCPSQEVWLSLATNVSAEHWLALLCQFLPNLSPANVDFGYQSSAEVSLETHQPLHLSVWFTKVLPKSCRTLPQKPYFLILHLLAAKNSVKVYVELFFASYRVNPLDFWLTKFLPKCHYNK